MKILTIMILFVLCTALSVGCGGVSDAPTTVEVTGTVTFDGEPVSEADIIFQDVAGKDKSYAAKVEKGAFSTTMTAGKKKVLVTAIREVPGKTILDGGGTGTIPMTEQYIPAKYNTKTTLEKEITTEGINKLTFDLQSK